MGRFSDLAAHGLSVIPLQPRDKRPAQAWHEFQTRTASEIELACWDRDASLNIGIVTGAISRVIVLDIDGAEGEEVVAQHGGLPRTPTVRTGKGRHIYFQHPEGRVRNFARRLPGLDLRGDGGYVVAPPSVHPSGPSYTWEIGLDDAPLAACPDWLLDLIRNKNASTTTSVRNSTNGDAASSAYSKAALASELAVLGRTEEGARNDQLNKSAFSLGQLVGSGLLERGPVEVALTAVALGIGLDATSIAATICSGIEAGIRTPRQAPDRATRAASESPGDFLSDDDENAKGVDDLDAARELVFGLVKRTTADAGAAFAPDALAALAKVKKADAALYARVRDGLRAAKISLRDLEREIRKTGLRVIDGGGSAGDEAIVERAGCYLIALGAICHEKDTRDGHVRVPLCNFSARIIGEVVRDDGAERTTAFEIAGNLQDGRVLPEMEVPSDRFMSMNWVPAAWGSAAILFAGQGTKDHLRAAIQMLSGEVKRRTVFTHLGWRKIDGQWAYLHADGAIGTIGTIPGIEVDPGDANLRDYQLPELPSKDELLSAVNSSLKLLDLAPTSITYPLLAAIYRAPLGEVAAIDLSVFLAGPTGSQKSELTAQAQAHFGSNFSGRNLPGSWVSTGNTLEKQGFLVKDAIFTVDDFAPTGSAADVQRLHRDADRLLRAQGNRSGRGRMRADGTLRPSYFPRGLVVASGEDIPRGHSLRARTLILEVGRGQVDLSRLTSMQAAANQGHLAQSIAGYLRWLAPQIDVLKTTVSQKLTDLRARARTNNFAHDRTADMVASLAYGLNTFLEFAVCVGALQEHQRHNLADQGWQALISAAATQSEHQEGEAPAGRFLSLLRSALISGRAHFLGANGGRPNNPSRWGWRERPNVLTGEWQAIGAMIGWIEGIDVFLDPDASYAEVQRLAQTQNDPLAISQRTLWKRLDQAGFLAGRDTARGRIVVRKMIGGRRLELLHLRAETIVPENVPSVPNGPDA